MTKDGFFKKYEYVYDEYYDCYICPNNKTLTYRTTNRDGYREYKSCGAACAECPYLSQCTESRDHVKTVTRHIWETYMEICEDIRQILGITYQHSTTIHKSSLPPNQDFFTWVCVPHPNYDKCYKLEIRTCQAYFLFRLAKP